MVQAKIFGARDEILSDARAAAEQQANAWLRDELPNGATAQVSSALAVEDGKYLVMITLAITTPDA